MTRKIPDIPESPGDRLRWARAEAGYNTATDAAMAIGVPLQTYISHENSNRGLGRNAQRYAVFFRVSLDWLLTGRGAPKGRAPIEEIYDELPPDAQRQAIEYLEFLKSKRQPD